MPSPDPRHTSPIAPSPPKAEVSGMSNPANGRVIGSPVRRREDAHILTGRTAYIDDISLPGMLEGAILRSPHAHARILSIDTTEAEALPGVYAVLTGEDLIGKVQPQPVIWYVLPDQKIPDYWALARDRVRWVGQPVAAVAAKDRYLAEDALELIKVEYDELPAVVSLDDALRPGGPKIYDDWEDNIGGSVTLPKGNAAKAFEDADIVVETTFDWGRQMGMPLEPRGCVAQWDPLTKELTVWLSTQSADLARDLLGDTLTLPGQKIRVITPDVGGGFGNKFDFYAEEIIASCLSLATGRAVKLLESRAESFVANAHSRNVRIKAEMAATKDGRITGIRGTVWGVMGAVNSTVGAGPVQNVGGSFNGPYDIPNIEVTVCAVHTNLPPYGSYRGWGMPKGHFAHERLVERLAKSLGITATEIRRKNLIRDEQFPYQSQSFAYDSGHYLDLFEKAEAAIEELGWQKLVDEGRAVGRSLGIGRAYLAEVTAFGGTRTLNASGLTHSVLDEAVVRMDSSGGVTVLSGQVGIGQGIGTALAQIAADTMGVPFEAVDIVMGDTAAAPFTGYGSAGTRGAGIGGAAVMGAAKKLREKVLRIAANLLEASPEDLEIAEGVISVRGVPGKTLTMRDIGDAAYRRIDRALPESEDPTLEERFVYDPSNATTSYGYSAALLEVDRESGQTKLLHWLMYHDCGVMINPTIVEGQIIGGLAQGIGGALLEELTYDPSGKPTATDLHHYQPPTANEVPVIEIRHTTTPSTINEGGFKGIGECGTITPAAVIASGIEDALHDLDIEIRQVPMTAPRIRQLISTAQEAVA